MVRNLLSFLRQVLNTQRDVLHVVSNTPEAQRLFSLLPASSFQNKSTSCSLITDGSKVRLIKEVILMLILRFVLLSRGHTRSG